ncbi:MAG: galactose mutarotase [Alistipes senegalensis]|nr:galactose mutarotase [Bacteroides cellulosilyticus]MCM1351424.1 galactose mutarotase [Alistipes senegalensis]
MNKLGKILLVAGAACACACAQRPQTTKSGLAADDFVAEIDGAGTALYTLANANGMEAAVTNFGGRVVSLMVPDRDGTLRDVVLGFDCIDDYIHVPSDFGASIGRYANRIAQGRFTLDGVAYDLPKNNFGHCLHGGPNGWQYRIYDVVESDASHIVLALHSPDGDEGFPGAVDATVTYRLTDDNALEISYEATTDAPTIVNMTNHSYFNLSGDPTATICDHWLQIAAESFTPVDDTFMTTGEIAPVAGTPMDFRTAKRIGAEIDRYDYVQLKNGNGYDHNWVLSTAGDLTRKAAELRCDASGIVMELYTDEPGVQVYTGNFLDGTITGKKGIVYNQRAAVCLETQHYPDSPNKPAWPSPVLHPGETYRSHCIYRFSVAD